MRRTSNFVLPLDPEYIGHREQEERRKETRDWLLHLNNEPLAPPVVLDTPNHGARRSSRSRGRKAA
jgi:hypothetical protein